MSAAIVRAGLVTDLRETAASLSEYDPGATVPGGLTAGDFASLLILAADEIAYLAVTVATIANACRAAAGEPQS